MVSWLYQRTSFLWKWAGHSRSATYKWPICVFTMYEQWCLGVSCTWFYLSNERARVGTTCSCVYYCAQSTYVDRVTGLCVHTYSILTMAQHLLLLNRRYLLMSFSFASCNLFCHSVLPHLQTRVFSLSLQCTQVGIFISLWLPWGAPLRYKSPQAVTSDCLLCNYLRNWACWSHAIACGCLHPKGTHSLQTCTHLSKGTYVLQAFCTTEPCSGKGGIK